LHILYVGTYFIIFRFLKLYPYNLILYCIVMYYKVVRYNIEVSNREDRYGPETRTYMLFYLLYCIISYKHIVLYKFKWFL
jgi:hypothetical protein